MRNFSTILILEDAALDAVASAASPAEDLVLVAAPATAATARERVPGGHVVADRDPVHALRTAIAAARHDRIWITTAHERPDAALRAALEEWRAGDGGPPAHRVARSMRYLGREMACRDWQARGPVRFFDRRAGGWEVRAGDGAIVWPGACGRLAGTLQVQTPTSLATLVAAIDRSTRQPSRSDVAGTLAAIVSRPPVALVRGWISGRRDGRAGFFFAVLDGLHALVREVRGWEGRRTPSP